MEKRKGQFYWTQEMNGPKDRKPLQVGIAGLGAVGLEVARRLIAGVPDLALAAVAVRDAEKARRAAAASRR